MKARFRLLCLCLGLATLPLLAAPQIATPPAKGGSETRRFEQGTSTNVSAGFVSPYCVSFHGRARPAAGLAFDRLDSAAIGGHEDTWEKVVAKVRAGDMPPAGARAPDASTRTAFVISLESTLD